MVGGVIVEDNSRLVQRRWGVRNDGVFNEVLGADFVRPPRSKV